MVDARIFYAGATVAAFLYLFHNLFIPLPDYDSALYAQVARELYEANDFSRLTFYGAPFLDKPHMHYWLSALSFRLFGVSDFAYRLPSFLALLTSAFVLYRWCSQFIDNPTSAWQVMAVFSTSMAMLLMAYDVRLEPLLLLFNLLSIWQFTRWLQDKKNHNLFISIAAVAAGYYTKGAIAVIMPVCALLPAVLLFYRKMLCFRNLFVALLFFVMLILPLMWLGYHQFGEDGVWYYLYRHITGRASGEWISNHAGVFYLWHTLLWVVLPWTLPLLAGLYFFVKHIRRHYQQPYMVLWVSITGLVFSIVAFSLSSFQLSYYIYPLLPFAAVIIVYGARYFFTPNRAHYLFTGIMLITISAMLAMGIWIQIAALSWAILLVLLGVLLYVLWKQRDGFKATVVFGLMVFTFLSLEWLPMVVAYQPNTVAAAKAVDFQNSGTQLVTLNIGRPYALAFYSGIVPDAYYNIADLPESSEGKSYGVYTNAEGFASIQQAQKTFSIDTMLMSYRITKLSPAFLNPSTRKSVCDTLYVLKMH